MRKRVGSSGSVYSKSLKKICLTLLRKAFYRLFRLRVLVLIATLSFALYQQQIFVAAYKEMQERTYAFLYGHDLVVKNIYLEGQRYAPEEEIIQAIATDLDTAMFSVDIYGIKKRMEALPWLKHVSVERQFPSTLAIHITERQPTFLWQKEGRLYVVDNEGNVIEKQETGRFTNLIILVGEDAPHFASHILDVLLKDPNLFSLISSMTYVGHRRWDIQFYNDVMIKLPEKDIEAAWKKLSEMNQENKALFTDIKVIDLRLLPEKLFIR